MLKANKLLGQNWLINPKIHQKILAAAEIVPADVILEVGPGTGLLTKLLVQTGARVLAIEKDHQLAEQLARQFKIYKNVTIIPGDILKIKPQNYGLSTKDYKILGNIPYYLTSHLLRLILEKWPAPKLIVMTIQKEVAQRIIASPPHMNLLGLAVQWHAQAEIIATVAKGNFRPVPKVDSAVVKIIPQPLDPEKARLTPFLFKIARVSFSGKRKQLLNSVATGLSISKTDLELIFKKMDLDGQRRPETLSIPEWQKLSSTLSSFFSAD